VLAVINLLMTNLSTRSYHCQPPQSKVATFRIASSLFERYKSIVNRAFETESRGAHWNLPVELTLTRFVLELIDRPLGDDFFKTPPTLFAIMSISPSAAARCCAHTLRLSNGSLRTASLTARQRRRPEPARRWQTTDAAAAGNPKIVGIVDQISQLTLLETADLVSSLKVPFPSAIGRAPQQSID